MRSTITGNAICPARWPRLANAAARPRIATNHLGTTTPMTIKKVDAMIVRPKICRTKWCHNSCTAPISTNVSPISAMAAVITQRDPCLSITGPTARPTTPPRKEPMDIGIV